VKQIRLATIFLLLILSQNLKAQQTVPVDSVPSLNSKLRFGDTDRNDTLSKEEVRTVLDQYLNNPARNVPCDLVTDVENVVIDLIGYLEKINCEALKKTAGSKRFIELYFVNKFIASR
jgi:hypothetical protein